MPRLDESTRTTGDCCTDCALWLANGDPPPDWTETEFDAWQDRIEAEWGGWYIAIGDDTTDFTWSHCQVCGSTLGGARYNFAAWQVTQ
jgi:hypothetical protein